MKKHQNEGHFGYPLHEGMPELTDDGKPGFDWCFAAIVTVIGICAGAALVLFVQILMASPSRAEGAVVQTTPMLARVLCFDLDRVSTLLQSEHGETIAQMGRRSTGEAVLMFLNPDTDTFTIGFVRASDGLFCALVAGDQWDMPGLTATRGEGL
jgi:hypothetical protein